MKWALFGGFFLFFLIKKIFFKKNALVFVFLIWKLLKDIWLGL